MLWYDAHRLGSANSFAYFALTLPGETRLITRSDLAETSDKPVEQIGIFKLAQGVNVELNKRIVLVRGAGSGAETAVAGEHRARGLRLVTNEGRREI